MILVLMKPRTNLPGGDAVFDLRGLTIGYGDRAVVRDIDLAVRPGEAVAVVGANGSGKTTLVRGLLGLAQLQKGSLDLFGIRHDRFRQRWRIGYVPQRHSIGGVIPSSVGEVVASGRLARRSIFGRRRPADAAAVRAALAQVGLSDRARDPVSTLSGGQQRRVLIARALASEPDVLVMDEPTAGVDADTRQALARTLESLASTGSTMLIVTHDVAPFADLVTRVLLVRDGRLAFDGPPQRVPGQVLVTPHLADDPEVHHEPEADQPLSPSGLGMTG